MQILIILFLIVNFNVFSKEDTGLSDAIKYSNILQLNPKPHIRMKGSLVYQEPIVCEVNPMSGSLLVTMNPHHWYALSAVDQINSFCKEMNNCDSRIKCKKL